MVAGYGTVWLMQPTAIQDFQDTVWAYYAAHGRQDLPWRQPERDGTFDPYKIMVSELMLQQTQVPRVVPKFTAFMAAFPTVQALAAAPLARVLEAWSGLGYNRRAKFLWQAAQALVERHGGQLPNDRAQLLALPGIGPGTAGAILVYAFNRPEPFIETNVRSVFFHHFFADQTDIADAELLPLVAAALPEHETRDWYWALMDYGTHLKRTVGNAARASKHYAKQSVFQGSRRQIRGQVLKLLTAGPLSRTQLQGVITDERLDSVLNDLLNETFIEQNDSAYRLRA